MSLGKSLVNAVNPRLSLYTRAACLAFLILTINYAIVVVLSYVLMGLCQTIATSVATSPIVSGGTYDQEAWINKTFALENVVITGKGTIEEFLGRGGVTVTTTIDACHEKSLAPVSSPFPGCFDNDWNSIPCGEGIQAGQDFQTDVIWSATRQLESAFRGTGRISMLPCWKDDLPCVGRQSWDDVDGWFGCGYYEGAEVYHGAMGGDWRTSLAYYPERAAAFAYPGNEMGEKMKRFPWCSAKDEEKSMAQFMSMIGVYSSIAQRHIRLSMLCTEPNGIQPGGVTTLLYPDSGANVGISGAHEPSYTTYWNLNVTTTTETCPTFAVAFGNAFAFAAQIEMVITIALILAFKQTGLIKLKGEEDPTKDLKKEGKGSVAELSSAALESAI